MNIDKVLVISTAIIRDSKKQVLLIKRSKKSSYPDHWQLVEGKINISESPEETIRREVEEETKIEVNKLELKSVYHNEIEAKGLNFLCFRVVFNAIVTPNDIVISDEHTEFGWFNRKTVNKLILLPGTKEILEDISDL
ncbi:MAG: NUDIX hydrolase [bacterium]|nr:MAG: NUDIX hydrolase [bacterium]